jgi:hypothetical protein
LKDRGRDAKYLIISIKQTPSQQYQNPRLILQTAMQYQRNNATKRISGNKDKEHKHNVCIWNLHIQDG